MTTEIVVRTPENPYEPRDRGEAIEIAKTAAASKFFAMSSPEQALMAIMLGKELGYSAVQSLRSVHIIQGRPTLSADGAVGIVKNSPLCEYWQLVKSTSEECTIETKRKTDKAPVAITWTLADAERAGLTKRDMWKAYPRQMLRHRCAMELAREVYPDLLGGLYTPEEIESSPRTVDAEFVEKQQAYSESVKQMTPEPTKTAKDLSTAAALAILDKAAKAEKPVAECLKAAKSLESLQLPTDGEHEVATRLSELVTRSIKSIADGETLNKIATKFQTLPTRSRAWVAEALDKAVEERLAELQQPQFVPDESTGAA